ncbi:hypothetical protein EI42_06185 [Thermosporothrix hazakensis]|jgi:2-hydroxychromene-2-carboxylate isomerase|uniref:Uncharacterized protein n=2 Tax=Thermosporothrix TaxID=768650 RepID=A0A326U219_THEHA|nr:hypothetical protein [Thermosporothrix hazakensis]PZW19204.1 hypothetical protein EI42_06185 [Thermosporothrix hazakensis]BBH89712.1 hypothetical protein KTC_44630 [Thermosporothrix sp. COM3]GCE47899.1 hypothetical protein KTH_27680 [Thermosporothrix hazakensis]
MSEHRLLRRQRIYIPAVSINRATLKHSWIRVLVATLDEPEQICGVARRIGYTGKQEDALALYRLKIKQGHGHPTVTLPGIYIIDDGLFQDYEEWKQKQG